MSACNAPVLKVEPKSRGSGDLYLEGRSKSDVVAGLDVHEVAVLTQAHWDRIQYQLKKKEIEAEKLRKIVEARQQLHQLSLDKVKTWKNTVYGQRQKKLEARRQREEREENERINVDLLEAKHQAKERKAVIERAKVQLYYQTDRIKELHGALLHAEALKERDVQLEIKRLKDKLSVEQDRQWYVRYQRDFEAFNDADQNQIRERRRKNVLAADYQRSQIRHHQDELESAKDEDMKEGERLKKQAEEYEEELKQKAEERRRKALQQSADNRNQIEDIKYMKQVEETQREEEDEECRVFAKAKRNIMKLRAAKEKEMRDEKIGNLTKIQEKLALMMKEKQDDEDERIKRAVEEKEARRLKEEKESEERRLKRIKAVEEHRQEQMKVMERRKEEEKLEVVEMVKARKEADTAWFANELERLNKRRMEAEQLDTDQRQQAEERRKLENQEEDQDLEQERKNRELVVEEEKEFQDYAQDLIKLYKEKGRNAIPLQMAAREGIGGGLGHCFPGRGPLRPSYKVTDRTGAQLSNLQRTTTEDVKEKQGMDRTSKRLGFTVM